MDSSLHTPTTNPRSPAFSAENAVISPEDEVSIVVPSLAKVTINDIACVYDALVAASDAILAIRNQPRCRENEVSGDILDELCAQLGMAADEAADEMERRQGVRSWERGARENVLFKNAVRIGSSASEIAALAQRLQAQAA